MKRLILGSVLMAAAETPAAGNKTTKSTQMAQEAEKQGAAERPYIAAAEEWDKTAGDEFGGQNDILAIAVGEVAGPFEYIGHQPMILDGRSITVHIGKKEEENYRLPISSSFLRSVDQANLYRGDVFLIRRGDNVKKKAGQGKGQDMQIYAIKVKSRAKRPEGANAGVPF